MNDREELKIVCNKLGLNIDDIEFEIEGGRVVVLNLFNNMIEELPPTIFNNLPSLEYLGLYDNKIRELPVGLFDNLRFLRELSLGENKLSALSPKVLQDSQWQLSSV